MDLPRVPVFLGAAPQRNAKVPSQFSRNTLAVEAQQRLISEEPDRRGVERRAG